MRIIVSYASAGSGHTRAAEALYSYLRAHRLNDHVLIADVLTGANTAFKLFYSWGYFFLAKFFPSFWRFCFWVTQVQAFQRQLKFFSRVICLANTRRFAGFLQEQDADMIFCTHFLPAQIAADLAAEKKINSRVVNILTDLGAHPFWICGGAVEYVVATDTAKRQLVRRGVDCARIKVLGIPISGEFSVKKDKAALRRQIGLDPARFTVLVSTGSFAIGPVDKIVGMFDGEFQLIVVCARNKALFKRLNSRGSSDVKVFGFVGDIDKLMAASDLIITKPGGLTIAEILAMELPPLFITAIPGQETENMRILFSYGIGVYAADIFRLKQEVTVLKNNPDRLARFKANIRKLKRPFAAADICREFIELKDSGSEGPQA